MSSRLLKLSILMLFIIGFSAYVFFNQNLFSPSADQNVTYNVPGYATAFAIPSASSYQAPTYIPQPTLTPGATPSLDYCYHFNSLLASCAPATTISPSPQVSPTGCQYLNNILPSNCPNDRVTPSPTATSLPNHDPSPSPLVSPTSCQYVNNILPSNCPNNRVSPTPNTGITPTPSTTGTIAPSPSTNPSPSCGYVFSDTVQPTSTRPWWAVFWWWQPRQPAPAPTCPISQLTPTPRTTAPPTDFPTPPVGGCDSDTTVQSSRSFFQPIFSFFSRLFGRDRGDYPVGRCPSPSPSPRDTTTPSPEPTESTPTDPVSNDSITFTINLGPTRNNEIVFDSNHKTRLFIYDNDHYARTFTTSSSSRAKQNSDGTWSVTFKPRDIRSSAKAIPTGNYCAEIDYRFAVDGKTYASGYRASTYTTHTDREMFSNELGVFYYQSGSGNKQVNGLEFNEPTGQRRTFCPTN